MDPLNASRRNDVCNTAPVVNCGRPSAKITRNCPGNTTLPAGKFHAPRFV